MNLGFLDLSFRMFGTPVRISIWYWASMAFFGWLMGIWQMGGVVLLLIWIATGFLATMIRELGRIAVGRIFGHPGAIVLRAMGGGTVAEYERAHRWQRILINMAGIGTAFLVYGILYLLTPTITAKIIVMRDLDWAERFNHMLVFMMFQLLFWNLLNLAPILPMDGGKIFQDVIGYVVGKRDFLIATIVSVLVAGAIVGLSVNKHYHPEAPYLDGLFQSLYPYALRQHPFARFDPSPIFNAFIYGLMGVQNLIALVGLIRKK